MTGWWTKSGVSYREASGKLNGQLVDEAPRNLAVQWTGARAARLRPLTETLDDLNLELDDAAEGRGNRRPCRSAPQHAVERRGRCRDAALPLVAVREEVARRLARAKRDGGNADPRRRAQRTGVPAARPARPVARGTVIWIPAHVGFQR